MSTTTAIRRDLRRRRRDRPGLRLARGASGRARLRAGARSVRLPARPASRRGCSRRSARRPGARRRCSRSISSRCAAGPGSRRSSSGARSRGRLRAAGRAARRARPRRGRGAAAPLRAPSQLGLDSEWLTGQRLPEARARARHRGPRRGPRAGRGQRRSAAGGGGAAGGSRRATTWAGSLPAPRSPPPSGARSAWRLETADGRSFAREPRWCSTAGCWSGQAGLAPGRGAAPGPAGEGGDPHPARLGRASRSASGSSPASASTWCRGPMAG